MIRCLDIAYILVLISFVYYLHVYFYWTASVMVKCLVFVVQVWWCRANRYGDTGGGEWGCIASRRVACTAGTAGRVPLDPVQHAWSVT